MNLKATLITIGKLKEKSFNSIEHEFIKRLNSPINIIELKNNASNIEAENKLIIEKIESLKFKNPYLVALTEHGENFTSIELAKKLDKILQEDKSLIFIIGGSYGFSKEFLKKMNFKLSLSKLTFPHQFARIIFIEQLYRVQCILSNHPYHH